MSVNEHLRPDQIAQAIATTTAKALAAGALHPTETRSLHIEDRGVRFLVRIAANLQRKAAAAPPPGGKAANPFLPPEAPLTVGSVSDTHLAILNKFNVVDRHLLLITRRFESQEQALTLKDFLALWYCLAGYDGLGFYNGGAQAGASQPHKHLQVIPLPLEVEGPPLPVEALIDKGGRQGEIEVLPTLPFRHGLVRFCSHLWRTPEQAAAKSHACYLALLERLRRPLIVRDGHSWQSGAYNLLVTRRWMLLVPRARGEEAGIELNALGFAGSLFVRNEEALARLRALGPMQLLENATRNGCSR